MTPMLRALASALLLVGPFVGPQPIHAASKLKVAAVSDGAPGGGVFAGPSFTSWPDAAGDGWAVFRSQLEGGSSAEAIVAVHFTAPATRVQIARLGQRVDGAGTLRQFLGHPAITPNGDVAFFAAYRTDPGGDALAIFYYDHAPPSGLDALRAAVRDRDGTDLGALDLGVRPEIGVDAGDEDTDDRSVAVAATGQIVFAGATTDGLPALFSFTPGGSPTSIVKRGDAFGGGTFNSFGTPAINATGSIAFRALLEDASPAEGLFMITNGGAPTLRVGRGQAVSVTQADSSVFSGTIEAFGNRLALNDAGDLAFLCGPFTDPTNTGGTCASAQGGPAELGVCAFRNGLTSLLAYPSQPLSLGRVTSIRLGAAGSTNLARPGIAPDGAVTLFVSISDGAIEAVRRVRPPYGLANGESVVIFGGSTPTPDPTGGVYRSAASAPAVDANGAAVFFGRMAGGTTSEAVVYQPKTGDPAVVTQGEPAPNSGSGFFSGAAFSAPAVTDDGDVIFKAYVARGTTSVGIFKTHFTTLPNGTVSSTITRLVGANDVRPGGDAVLLDLIGDPDVAADGTVVFAAVADQNRGRGIYKIAPDGTISLLVERGVPAPGDNTFSSVGLAPTISRSGTVAFRASVRPNDPLACSFEGLFLSSDAGISAQVLESDPASAGVFVRLRDPSVSNVPTIAFRGNVSANPGLDPAGTPGMFVYTGDTLVTVATSGEDVGNGMVLDDFTGIPSLSDDGDLAFLISRLLDGQKAGSALLRRRNGTLDQVIGVGQNSPTGGTFRSLSQPTMTPKGRILFRASVEGGGLGGIFLTGDAGIRPYLVTNEITPIAGRFSAFGAKMSVNSKDDVAFTASISGGSARNGVFLASPSILLAPSFNWKVSKGRLRDRISLQLTLALGRVSNDINPITEAFNLAINDATGSILSVRVPAGTLQRKGRRFVLAAGKALPAELRQLRIVAGRKKTYRATIKTAPLDLLNGGQRQVKAPLSVSVEIADDGGIALPSCKLRPGGRPCGG